MFGPMKRHQATVMMTAGPNVYNRTSCFMVALALDCISSLHFRAIFGSSNDAFYFYTNSPESGLAHVVLLVE